VARRDTGNGCCRICRHGLEKWFSKTRLEKLLMSFPPRVADVNVKWLEDRTFECPVWRDGECLRGAGVGGGRDGGG